MRTVLTYTNRGSGAAATTTNTITSTVRTLASALHGIFRLEGCRPWRPGKTCSWLKASHPLVPGSPEVPPCLWLPLSGLWDGHRAGSSHFYAD